MFRGENETNPFVDELFANWHKNTESMKGFIAIIPSLLILQSCHLRDEEKTRRYILENGTERKVKLELYHGDIFISADSINGKGILKEATLENDGYFMNSAIRVIGKLYLPPFPCKSAIQLASSWGTLPPVSMLRTSVVSAA